MRSGTWPPDAWEAGTLRHGTHQHRYYVVDRHHAGPGGTSTVASIMLMHEFPGISAKLVEFAEQLADEFRVVVPSIVGRDGRPGVVRSAAQLCIRREVHAIRTGSTSPAVPWLRELLETEVSRGKPCGVIGMCLTGGFALALAIDPAVRAAVVAQPAIPAGRIWLLPLPGRRRRESDLGLSERDRLTLAERAGAGSGDLCARGYRFADDRLSPPSKLAAAGDLLGEGMKVVTLRQPRPTKHSTLTGKHRNAEAVAEVIGFLRERLHT